MEGLARRAVSHAMVPHAEGALLALQYGHRLRREEAVTRHLSDEASEDRVLSLASAAGPRG
jgi:hypothetical protein